MRKVIFVLFSIVSLMMTSCAVSSYMPELARKETTITNIYYTESPAGLMQTVECEDGHIAYFKNHQLEISDIGSVYVYYYPASLDNTNTRKFLECDILSIEEEKGELVSKLLVTYDDDSTEYYDLYMPWSLYEGISITGQINLTKEEFVNILKYNIEYEKIEG